MFERMDLMLHCKKWSRVFLVLLGALVLVFAGQRKAEASGPSAVIALVSKVEYEPSTANPKTATHVRIYGVFSLPTSHSTHPYPGDSSFSSSYGKPQAGYMYFACSTNFGTSGLDRCRTEWQEIAKLGANKTCVGFSDHSAPDAHNYTVRSTATRPSNPDTYNPRFGLGVRDLDQYQICKDIKTFTPPALEPAPSESPATDTGMTKDAGAMDSGAADMGTADTGTADTGTADTGTADTGSPEPGTPDMGTPDTGSPDPGTADMGTADMGTADMGTPDAGTPDAGTPDAGTPEPGTADTGTTTDKGTTTDTGATDTGATDTGGASDGAGQQGCGCAQGGEGGMTAMFFLLCVVFLLLGMRPKQERSEASQQ